MKKIFVLASILTLSSSVFAAADVADFTAGGTSGSSTTVTTANCTALNETVTVKLSKSNVGSYNCTGGVNIGVSAASTAGKTYNNNKGRSYSASSSGGAVVETDCANAACSATDTAAAAATANSAS